MGMDCTTSTNSGNTLFSQSHHHLQMMLNAAAVLQNRSSTTTANIPTGSPTGPENHESKTNAATVAAHLNGTSKLKIQNHN